MTIEMLLSRLDGVRQTAKNRWIAHCPAHHDRSPSLSVRLLDDGRILLHDFAGCGTDSVLANVGLTFADLFPDRLPAHHFPRVRQPYNAQDVLRCLSLEVLVLVQIAAQLERGNMLNAQDRERLIVAARRFQSAERILNE